MADLTDEQRRLLADWQDELLAAEDQKTRDTEECCPCMATPVVNGCGE